MSQQPPQPAEPSVGDQANSALVAAAGLAKTAGRDELVARLQRAQGRLRDPSIRVLVVGEFKQGKSSLINALVSADVCPVDDDVATSVATAVRFSEQAAASITLAGPDGEPGEVESVSMEELARAVSEAGNPGNERGVLAAEAGIPRALLKTGLVLVDTPGVGGLGSRHATTTIAALPEADAVVLVTSAAQEMSGPEIDFLKIALELCPNVVVCMTKIDFYPEWKRILELDRGHLKSSGIAADVIPVSTLLRREALRSESKELNSESGYAVLVDYLQKFIVGNAQKLMLRGAVNDALAVVAEVAAPHVSERKVLTDPEGAAELIAALQGAKEQAEQLRGQAAKWQQTLGDGVGDMSGDVDFDFRGRMRGVTADADDAIEKGDPSQVWEEFESWMYKRVAAEVAENYAMLASRAEELAARIAEHFAGVEGAVDLALGIATPDLEAIDVQTGLKLKKQGKAAKGMLAIRGTYSSVSMFGMLGNYVGLTMMNPATVVLGLLSGRKALSDEKTRQIEMRRQQAKQSVRRYVDEVSFQIGKDSRDALRKLQRDLRDAFTERAEELQRSTQEALMSAQSAVQMDQAQRQQRLQQLQAELQKMEAVRQQIAALAPEIARSREGAAPA